MLSRYELDSVMYMIDHTNVNDYPFIKSYVRMELDMIENQSRNRILTENERNAAEFAIETLIQLEKKEFSSNRHTDSLWCDELRQKFLISH